MALRQRAEADERLHGALGRHHAFLSASLRDIGDKSEAMPKHDVRLVYFNYVTNRAIHVWISGDEVKAVRVQPDGYQPPESDEEIATAEEIIRRDPRYREGGQGLPVRGILTPAPERQRYISLIFKRPHEPEPLAWIHRSARMTRRVDAGQRPLPASWALHPLGEAPSRLKWPADLRSLPASSLMLRWIQA
jgi:hypothetical protein